MVTLMIFEGGYSGNATTIAFVEEKQARDWAAMYLLAFPHHKAFVVHGKVERLEAPKKEAA